MKLLFLLLLVHRTWAMDCDLSNPMVPEGLRGQDVTFPWLGILRVHLHEGNKFRIAVTGVILVKGQFAIVNANDITRIPVSILKDDSRVMFFIAESTPWYCAVKDFINHPEYGYVTMNTISLLELESNGPFRAVPICWPTPNLNPGHDIFAVGYTDENMLLEKFINKLQIVEKNVCDEFYSRANLMNTSLIPAKYKCAFAVMAKKNCVWDNGMAFATNISGHWVLMGLGIQGPGCAAPSRFIDLTNYFPWTSTAMTLDGADDSLQYRRRGVLGRGFRKPPRNKSEFENVPIHNLFREEVGFLQSKNLLRQEMVSIHLEAFEQPGEEEVKHTQMFYDKYLDQYIDIAQEPQKIHIFFKKWEMSRNDCLDRKKMGRVIYTEETDVYYDGGLGSGTKELSLYDLYYYQYRCITLDIKSKSREKAKLWFTTQFKYRDNKTEPPYGQPVETVNIANPGSGFDRKYWNQIRYHQYPKWTDPDDGFAVGWKFKPNEKLVVKFLDDQRKPTITNNLNLLVHFQFRRKANLKLTVYAETTPQSKKQTVLRNTSTKLEGKSSLRVLKPYSLNKSDVNHFLWSSEDIEEKIDLKSKAVKKISSVRDNYTAQVNGERINSVKSAVLIMAVLLIGLDVDI